MELKYIMVNGVTKTPIKNKTKIKKENMHGMFSVIRQITHKRQTPLERQDSQWMNEKKYQQNFQSQACPNCKKCRDKNVIQTERIANQNLSS